ncbi:MAG: ABC transporter ATP-binding protein [Desulfosporosinus sp. BRH_c37]|nr:MAG: ABC transporter ATP-binding protein [Desulfosporosinus sp. BRH_c37]
MLKGHAITKVFNRGTINQKLALDGVDIHLKQGEFVTVIGSNGAGKTTLLNSLAGNFFLDNGKLILAGNDITKLPRHKRANLISRVFQDPMLGTAAAMTIEENMVIALRRGLTRRLRKAITTKDRNLFREELCKLGLGLENRLTNKVSLLSGGQRQALTLLMATLREPKLLLLDEHTAALDPKTAEKVLDLTVRVQDEYKLTTFMVTHNLTHALEYGNRTIMMHEGRIILDIKEEERRDMTVARLLKMFEKASGTLMNNDRMMLV